jgi:hypothetical protein
VDEAGASRAALNLLEAGYTGVHVISGGLEALAAEAQRRQLNTIVGTREAADLAAPPDH